LFVYLLFIIIYLLFIIYYFLLSIIIIIIFITIIYLFINLFIYFLIYVNIKYTNLKLKLKPTYLSIYIGDLMKLPK